jgi:hypothetical protein
MDRFPALRLILRYGRAGSAILAVVVALAVLAALWPAIGWPAVVLAPPIGAFAYLIAKSYVEIVQIVVEMVH